MLGERLRFAREAVGLRQADSAKHLGIVDSGICDMESGRRDPKAAQLAALAELYNRPVSFFFSEEPLPREVVLWRGKPDAEGDGRRIQREFFSLCEDYQELEEVTGKAAASRLPEDSTPKERFGYPQAESLALRIWQEFDLGSAPAESLRQVMEERYYVKIFALSLAHEASAASTRSPRFGPATLLNRDNVHWRRNFDLAHELFHLLTWGTFRTPEEESSIEADEYEESLANCFASRLLLPEGPFLESIDPFLDREGNLSTTVNQIHELARSFDVSAEAILYRCAGMLRWHRDQTEEAVDKVRVSRVWRENRVVESLPSRYVSLALEAYRQGLISYRRAARYLRKGFKEAQDILETPGDDIQQDDQITIAAD